MTIVLISTSTMARDFDMDTLDYRNIKEGPESPKETRDSKYPVSMSVEGMDLVITNKLARSVEVNGWRFDSRGCDVDLPKKGFRLPAGGRFVTFVGHCPNGSMKWGYLNVGNQTKKFNLLN